MGYYEADNSYRGYRKESEKTIKKWREEAEVEKNQRLKLSIYNHVKGQEVDRLEARVENLMEEYNKLRKTQEEKVALNKNHDELMACEKGLLVEARKTIQTIDYEKQKARTYYTEKN